MSCSAARNDEEEGWSFGGGLSERRRTKDVSAGMKLRRWRTEKTSLRSWSMGRRKADVEGSG
jgi:hypothetical protein